MKRFDKHIVSLLFSIAVYLVFGNTLMAAEAFPVTEKATVVSSFDDGNDKPIVFDTISLGEASQFVSHNEYLGLDFVQALQSNHNFTFAHLLSNFDASYSLKDKRALIFKHLYPFHFFW